MQKGFASITTVSLPLFPLAMMGGLLVQLLIARTSWAVLVDKKTLQRIQGLALEFLVVAAVATIKVPVVVQYAIPLLIQQTTILLFTVWSFFWLGKRMFKENWFEHSIAVYGTMTGVLAVGLMLLRTVDPENETNVGQVYALRSIFTAAVIGGGLLTSILPLLITTYGAMKIALACTLFGILCLVITKLFGWWATPSDNSSYVNVEPPRNI